MEATNYIEIYRYLLNRIRQIESGEISYTIDFAEENDCHNFDDAQFSLNSDGDYALSFTSHLHPLYINTISHFVLHSKWHDVLIDSVNIRQKQLTLSVNDKSIPYLLTTKSFKSTKENEMNKSCICAFYKYDHNEFNPRKSCIINTDENLPQHRSLELSIKDYKLEIVWGDKNTMESDRDERYIGFISKDPVSKIAFMKIVNSIRLVWGLITGYYIGKAVSYVSYEPMNEFKILQISYHNLQEEFISFPF